MKMLNNAESLKLEKWKTAQQLEAQTLANESKKLDIEQRRLRLEEQDSVLVMKQKEMEQQEQMMLFNENVLKRRKAAKLEYPEMTEQEIVSLYPFATK